LYEYHHEPREVWLYLLRAHPNPSINDVPLVVGSIDDNALPRSRYENSTARATECDGSGEDPTRSDSVELLELSGEDHTTYFAPLDAGPCFV